MIKLIYDKEVESITISNLKNVGEQKMSNYDLQKFIIAHQRDYATALYEIRNGRKRSHWMWYIFPQLKGLGKGVQSDYYSISGLDEARAYLEHPVLSKNLF